MEAEEITKLKNTIIQLKTELQKYTHTDVCSYCGFGRYDGVNLKQCVKCKQVRYCDKLCQHQDWINHKNTCKK